MVISILKFDPRGQLILPFHALVHQHLIQENLQFVQNLAYLSFFCSV